MGTKELSNRQSSDVYLEDCMDGLKCYEDNYFDLAIVDPPYGCIKENTEFKRRGMKILNWDTVPLEEYFNELFRVSKNQIIWGANYFKIPIPKSVIVWDKKNYSPLYGDAELAYFYGKLIGMRTSGFNMGGVKLVKKNNVDLKKIHPTQKPIYLYEWLLKYYAKPSDKILDTHLGSGSSRIAAYKGGFDFTGFEINKEYYDKQEKRFNEFKSQMRIF